MFYACMNLLPSKLEVSCQIEFIKILLDVALMFSIKLKIIKNTVCLCKMHLQRNLLYSEFEFSETNTVSNTFFIIISTY